MATKKTPEEIRKAIQRARKREAADTGAKLTKIRKNLKVIRSGATPAEMSARLRDMCNENGYDPIFELMELIRRGVRHVQKNSNGEEIVAYVPLKSTEQIAIHKELVKYIYPTLKAVDIKGSLDANIQVVVKSYSSPTNGNPVPVDADFSMVGDKLVQHLEEQIENVVQN